jgi:biopolymer transport protein ExbD
MARGMRRYIDRRIPQTFKIQITSMVDMFVILLVFLLKSYSTSPVIVNPSNELVLPTSTSSTDPVDIIKMVVSKKGIFIEDKKVLDFNSQMQVQPKDTDATDPMAIQPLFHELEAKANLVRTIASVNDKVSFDGKILVQADRDLPYSLLQKVLYTAMLSGYSDVKFAVLSREY